MVKIQLHYKKRQCGIYCIRNRINGKIYIGSSQNAYHRVRSQHFDRLQGGVHTNPHLQAAWNQYGKENFESFLLEKCDKSILIAREQWYLDNTLCLDNRYGYNINVKAECTVLTPAQCKKISQRKMGHSVSKECRQKLRKFMLTRVGKNHANYGKYPIFQYTKNGDCVGKYNTLFEAEQLSGFKACNIKQWYLGRHKPKGNFIWKRPERLKLN